MNGSELISEALLTGRFLGLGVGSPLAEAERLLGDGVRQIHGKKDDRLLRCDFGLVEVTFDGEPSWECRWYTVHLHRLEGSPELAEEVRKSLGVRIGYPLLWTDLSPEVRQSAEVEEAPSAAAGGSYPAWTKYRVDRTRATVHAMGVPGPDPTGGTGLQSVEKILIGI